jgi:hypothetical protein
VYAHHLIHNLASFSEARRLEANARVRVEEGMQRLGLIEIWALYGDGGFRHGLGRCEDRTVLG